MAHCKRDRMEDRIVLVHHTADNWRIPEVAFAADTVVQAVVVGIVDIPVVVAGIVVHIQVVVVDTQVQVAVGMSVADIAALVDILVREKKEVVLVVAVVVQVVVLVLVAVLVPEVP